MFYPPRLNLYILDTEDAHDPHKYAVSRVPVVSFFQCLKLLYLKIDLYSDNIVSKWETGFILTSFQVNLYSERITYFPLFVSKNRKTVQTIVSFRTF